MAYRNNLSTQISMDDSFERLTERQKKVVLKSWAKDFADYVFPSINSDAFRVLYSNSNASRPSVPANYIIGAMIIKELLGLTDDETVDMAQEEQDAQARPELQEIPDMSAYDTVFISFPNWWGTYPMAVATFLDNVDLKGKNVIPVCTHEGSRLGRSQSDLEDALPDSNVLDGFERRGGMIADDAETKEAVPAGAETVQAEAKK